MGSGYAGNLARNIKTFLITLGFGCTLSCEQHPSYKLVLKPDMIINEVAKGDASFLIDEQGQQDKLPADIPVSTWKVTVADGTTEWHLPANVVIDLKRAHAITSIYLYTGKKIPGVCRINYGIPFKWTSLMVDSMDNQNTWNEHRVESVTTRFLQISKEADSDLREIIIYGYPTEPEPVPEKPQSIKRKRIPLDQAIGINTHYLDPFEKVKVAGIAREYHNWILNEGGFTKNYPGYPDNSIQWSPASPLQTERDSVPAWDADQTGFDFDKYYKTFKDSGLTIVPCIQGTVPWLGGEPNVKSRNKPLLDGNDPLDPASYEAHSDFMFQYAARYGNTKVPPENLKAAPNQLKKSGLGYIDYFENWNEPDGWWSGRKGYFSPYEYAAMSSADYDGHESSMGKNKGIKNADPKAKMVMSGIAIPNVDYIRAMKFWFDHNRKDKKFVFDVITVHHYCNENGGQAGVMAKGISPEADNIKALMQKVCAFRDENAPSSEVWITEFGWDTNPFTPQSAPSQEIQGQWLARTYLACFAAGIDRAMMYMLRDMDPASRTQFSSSGLVGPIGDFSAKPSWYYIYTLRNQLAGLVYEGEEKASTEHVIIHKFKALNSPKRVYVLWSYASGSTVVNYKLPVTSVQTTLVMLKDGHTNGASRRLTNIGGVVEVEVTGSPVFVHVD